MKLTDAQKKGIRRAVAELAADHITSDWGEPLKDVDQSEHWPSTDDEDKQEDLSSACDDYLDTATRDVAKQLRRMK